MGLWWALVLLSAVAHGQFFAAQKAVPVGKAPVLTVACDLSGDGKTDFAVANFEGNSISVMVNQGGATFVQQVVGPANGPYGVACADLNHDGKLDLIWCNDGTQDNLDQTLSFVLNMGTAGGVVSWSSPPTTFSVGLNPSDIATGDLNRDGNVDVVVSITNGEAVVLLFNQHSNATSSGNVTFAQQVQKVGKAPYGVGIADFDGDGFPDIVLTNNGDTTISVLRNPAQPGLFMPSFASQTQYQAGDAPLGLWEADVNQDGRKDVIVSSSNVLTVLLNTGTQPGQVSFEGKPVFLLVGNVPAEVAGADVNGDGLIDLLCTNYLSNTVSVVINTGAPNTLSFAASVAYRTGDGPWGIATGDFDGDGKVDIVVTNEVASSATVLLNVATAQPTVAPFVDDGLSGGAIFGIVLGISLGFILLIVAVWALIGLVSKRAAYPPNAVPMQAAPSASSSTVDFVAPPASAPPGRVTDFDD